MIVAILLFILLLVLFNYLIHPLFLNKLNLQRLPGPYHYKFSKFFIYNKMRKEQGMLHIHHLHEKYGPIVQISPNEVSATDTDIVKKIYLNDNYPKESMDFIPNLEISQTETCFPQVVLKSTSTRKKFYKRSIQKHMY